MDKYTKTAGLNYLSENSYKGDGSPGMVMGIASDARGDTNTYEGLGDMIGKGIHKFIDYLTSARFKNIGGEKPGIEVNKHMSPLVQRSRQVILTFKNGYGVSIIPEYKRGGKSGMEMIDGYYEVLRLKKAEPGTTKPRGPDNEDGPIIKLKNGDLYVTSGENMRRLDDAELDNVLITTQKAEPEGLEEAGKPTTNSKHSTERELKKYDPAHGHTKPEGGKPGVCSCITSSGPSTDCSKCQGTGEIITPKRKDPKVDEALEDIMRLSGKERTDEGKMSEIHAAANELSKEEFAKEYPDWVDEYENAQVGPDEDDTVHEADGSGSYGGQSPLTYDTQRSSKMKEEDDQIDEIVKLSGLGEDILSDRKIWVGDSLSDDAEEKLKTVSKEDIAMAKAIDPAISGSPFPDMSMIDIINKRVMLIVKKWNDSLLSKDYPMGTTKEDIEQAVYDQIGDYLESGNLNEIEDGWSAINDYRGPAYVEWKQSLGPNADKLIKQAVSMSTNRHTDWHVGSNLDPDALYDRDEYELIDPKLGSGKAEKFGIWADDELNEIAKLSGLGEERKRRPDVDDYDDDDDNWDSDEDEKPEDPDKDKVPHILMQVKKALDVDGDHDIHFENGDKHKFSVVDLNIFLTNYLDMKPEMREKMQEAAITGQEEFENIVSILSPKKK